jgi:hypothetical protein
MADDYNTSHSHQTDGQAPTPEPAGTPNQAGDSHLYAFADCNRVNMQNGGTLLIHRHSDAQMMVAPEVAIAMQSCRTFRTLQQHVEVLTSTIPQLAGQQTDVANVLNMVKDAGLMTSAESTCLRLTQNVEPAVNLPPTRVFIITCDRPAAAQRLLESMLHAGNLSRHENLFLVDDSRDPQNAELNREAATRFNLSSPKNIQYVGAEAQQQLMGALITELPEHEQGIRFLIDRQRWAEQKSYGLARTICLLLSVDCRAIVMDDDVICAAVPSPHKSEGLTFGDSRREVDFYSSEQDILNRTAKADFDPLTGHAQCLGLTLGQALQKLGIDNLTEQHLQNANAAYLSQWQADSPILVTQSGTMGDPGTPGTQWIYTIDPTSTQRLLASAEGFEGALVNRHYWMGQPRPQFGKLAVMSQVTGLDNSHLLPPYFPVFRGEDYLFGAMVEHLHPHAAVLEYDWCVPHFPVETRRGDIHTSPPSGKGTMNPSKYITDRTIYESDISPETRLANLTTQVRQLCEMSDRGLQTLFRQEVAQNQSALAKRITNCLQDGTVRPEAWQKYLQQYIGTINEAMQSTSNLADIPGITPDHDHKTVLQEFRTLVNDYSLALQSWVSVRNTAKRVSDSMLSDGCMTP